MAYYNKDEVGKRLEALRGILREKGLDAALVYFDELNIANGWYLTGWAPQFEKGAVLVPVKGEPILLGGPESEPFAQMASAISKTRSFPVFMVPEEEYPNATIIDFGQLNEELRSEGTVLRKLGFVGTSTIPHKVYTDFQAGFKGISLLDITDEYETLRAYKSPWEGEQIRKATGLCDLAFDAMVKEIRPGAHEYEVAAAGEYVCRRKGASSFAYTCIVGSGARAKPRR